MEGNRYHRSIEGRARPNDISDLLEQRHGPAAPMHRYVVLDVISDPASLTPARVSEIRDRIGAQLDFLPTAPHNSLIAQPVRRSGEAVPEPIVLFPFFSHLDLPVKAGEHVWVMFESIEERELGYWMSRVVTPRHVEDANYTHDDRKWITGLRPSLREKSGQAPELDPTPTFRNGIGTPESYSIQQSGPANPYDELAESSDAGVVHVNEPVPRFRKRPGDAVFEGSHNTLIVLGQDRQSVPFTLDGTGRPIGLPDSDESSRAGAIDLVAGRGQVPATAPLEIENTRGEIETNKDPVSTGVGVENLSEGDPNFADDLSRIFIAMNTRADRNLGIINLPNVQAEPDEAAPAVITKSDQVRIVARRDIKIVVAPAGIGEDAPDTEYASIVIKRSGDIIFSPSDSGVIRLGGEDADRAILCTDVPVVSPGAAVPDGRVVSQPIETTAAGKIGVGAGNLGTFATKILVRAT